MFRLSHAETDLAPTTVTQGPGSEQKSNKNAIELNRTIGQFNWVRQSNKIEHVFRCEFVFSNQSNKIEPIRCSFVRTVSL